MKDTEFVASKMNGRPYQAGKFALSLRRHLMEVAILVLFYFLLVKWLQKIADVLNYFAVFNFFPSSI